MPASDVPTERDVERIYARLARFGVRDLQLTPLLAARLLARVRVWRVALPGLCGMLVSFGALMWIHYTDRARTGAALGWLTVAYLSTQATTVAVFIRLWRADRRVGRAWPQRSAPPAAKDLRAAAGRWFVGTWILAHYGTLAIGAVTLASPSLDSGARLVTTGFVVHMFLLTGVSTAIFTIVIRRPSIGEDPQLMRGEVAIRKLDFFLLLVPFPLFLLILLRPALGMDGDDIGAIAYQLFGLVVLAFYAIGANRAKVAKVPLDPVTPALPR